MNKITLSNKFQTIFFAVLGILYIIAMFIVSDSACDVACENVSTEMKIFITLANLMGIFTGIVFFILLLKFIYNILYSIYCKSTKNLKLKKYFVILLYFIILWFLQMFFASLESICLCQ